MLNDIQHWNFADPFAHLPLDSIPRLSDRARSLVARNRSNASLRQGFFNIVGSIEMLAGLEYHHDNFARTCRDAGFPSWGPADFLSWGPP
jgi:hypothetical protein